jgi:hypothetical protein
MRTSFWSVALIVVVAATTAAAQDPPARGRQGQGGQGGFLGRPSPPRPQQHQSLDYFTGASWGLSERFFGMVLTREGDPAWVTPAFVKQRALEQSATFVHRDYHSRNLLLTVDNNPGILDFQDAVIAAHGLVFQAVANDGLVVAGQFLQGCRQVGFFDFLQRPGDFVAFRIFDGTAEDVAQFFGVERLLSREQNRFQDEFQFH